MSADWLSRTSLQAKANARPKSLLRQFRCNIADAIAYRRKGNDTAHRKVMETAQFVVLQTLMKKHGTARVMKHAVGIRNVETLIGEWKLLSVREREVTALTVQLKMMP